MKPNNPHIAWPFSLEASGRSLKYHEQDSDDEIFDCVEVILRTPIGVRIEIPDYGSRQQEFASPGARREELIAAVARWEERAELVIERNPDLLDELVDRLRVGVKGRMNIA